MRYKDQVKQNRPLVVFWESHNKKNSVITDYIGTKWQYLKLKKSHRILLVNKKKTSLWESRFFKFFSMMIKWFKSVPVQTRKQYIFENFRAFPKYLQAPTSLTRFFFTDFRKKLVNQKYLRKTKISCTIKN